MVEKKKKKDSRNQSTIAAIVRAQCKNTEFIVIYIKGEKKVQTEDWKKKKKKRDKVANQNGIVDE